MEVDWMQYFTVQVKKGSGCLFQPSSDGYSYVLTAKHVITDDFTELEVIQYDSNGSKKKLEILDPPYFHSTKDAAIIKVEKVKNLDLLLRAEVNLNNAKDWYLCGYPDTRRDNDSPFRKDPITIMNPTNTGEFEAEVNRFIEQKDIVGQSGGGFIKKEGIGYLLAGIQVQMMSGGEDLSRIMFLPLSIFDEIVTDNKENLSLLYPPYFYSLDKLIGDIFPLNNITLVDNKKNLLKSELNNIAKGLCSSFTGKDIPNQDRKSLLANDLDEIYIMHKNLWISFLELITIKQLHLPDKKLTIDDLDEINKKHKLLFLDCKEWVKKVDIIAKSDLSKLEKGGSIIISCTEDTSPTIVELDGDYVNDICQVPKSEMRIDSSINFADDLKIRHIYKFQKHIIENFSKFKNINNSNVNKTLVNETKDIV